MRIRNILAGMILIVTMATVGGCSSFKRDARTAREQPAPADSIEGLWEGRWYESSRPEHGGRLECVLTRTGDTLYRASTRSRWWRILSSSHDATVVVTPASPGTYILHGTEELWLFGGYVVTGRVDATSFVAKYTAGEHEGVMELTRPDAVAPQ